MLLFRDALEKLRKKRDREPHAELDFQGKVLRTWNGNHLVWDTGQDTRNNALILGQSISGVLLLPAPNLKDS